MAPNVCSGLLLIVNAKREEISEGNAICPTEHLPSLSSDGGCGDDDDEKDNLHFYEVHALNPEIDGIVRVS
jgi:hypothetical protein